MKRKTYQTGNDLTRAQRALMRWTQQVGDCNYIHKGDLGHRLFNGGYLYIPQAIFFYWEDDNGDIIAFANLYGWWDAFDLQVAPDYRYTDTHIELFEWCEQATLKFAQRIDRKVEQIRLESYGCDLRHDDFLTARGYTFKERVIDMTEHDLRTIPDATLPDGFTIRLATAEDMEQLVDVHNHSFRDKWTVELYGRVFNEPYMEREFVVVAPDGRFAAFTNVWHDDINHSILFEPVGTHSDFRRRGIGKAMMVHVLKTMQADHNIKHAYVCHELPDKNPASGKLYASVGFKTRYQIQDWVKSVTIS